MRTYPLTQADATAVAAAAPIAEFLINKSAAVLALPEQQQEQLARQLDRKYCEQSPYRLTMEDL